MRSGIYKVALLFAIPACNLSSLPAAAPIAANSTYARGAKSNTEAQANLPRASSVIEPVAYVSLDPVPRGRAFDVAVVLKIRPGFHVNAHEASEDFLIPTEVTAEVPAGLRTVAIHYPKGALRKFQFTQKPLNVYEGSVIVGINMQALADAPLGAQKIALKVRYQACTNEVCLPPVNLPASAEVKVAEAGAKSTPAHPEIFKPAQRSRARPPQPRNSSPPMASPNH